MRADERDIVLAAQMYNLSVDELRDELIRRGMLSQRVAFKRHDRRSFGFKKPKRRARRKNI